MADNENKYINHSYLKSEDSSRRLAVASALTLIHAAAESGNINVSALRKGDADNINFIAQIADAIQEALG